MQVPSYALALNSSIFHDYIVEELYMYMHILCKCTLVVLEISALLTFKYQTLTAKYDRTRFLLDCFNSVFTIDCQGLLIS